MSAPARLLTAVLLIVATAGGFAGEPPRGKQVFDLWCGGCHKRLAPDDTPIAGTSSLERKYQGREPAALEDRTDLTAPLIKTMVRHGYKSMPAARKTEISDADLDALTDYLTVKPKH